MSSTPAAPFGLKPAWHPSGCIRQAQGSIASTFGTNIFQFSPVRIIAASGLLEDAAGGERAVGVFMGVEWTATDGRRRVGNMWTAGTTGTDIVAYYTFDPAIVYEIQCVGTLTQALGLGEQFDWSALSGNTTTGLSSTSMSVTSAANAGLRVIGLNPAPDNAWGTGGASPDPGDFPIVQVQIAEHQYVADIAEIA